jgi:hypothetical protein
VVSLGSPTSRDSVTQRHYAQGRVAEPGKRCDRPSCAVEIQEAWWARFDDRVYCSWECRRFDGNRLRVLRRRNEIPHQREYEREQKLFSKYGITHGDYLRLLKEQDGKCAICRTDNPRQRSDHFHVDHDHVTGVVRGLLCSPCNQGLGYFQENVETLARAIAYLAGQTGEFVEGGD